MTPDIFNFISFAEYCLIDRLNFSTLKCMAGGGRMYKHAIGNPPKTTPAMLLGSVVHKMVLEPDQFSTEYAIWTGGLTGKGEPTMSKNSLAFREFAAMEADGGRTVIDQDMVTEAKAIRAAIMEHPVARVWIDGALVEQTVLWSKNGYECKSRIDIIQPGFICDLKSTVSADQYKFGKQAGDMKYHAQMAFYRDAWFAHTGELLPCKILAVEKTAPYEVACFAIPEDALMEGRGLYENWMKELKQCMDSGKWPFKNEEEQELMIPGYYFEDGMDSDDIDITGLEMKQ